MLFFFFVVALIVFKVIFVVLLVIRHLRFCRFYPASSDLWCWDRLYLPFLELGLRGEGGLPAIRQRDLQAPLRKPRHRSQERGLPPLLYHLVLLTQELQEIHQRPRGPLISDGVLPVSERGPQCSRQDKVHK